MLDDAEWKAVFNSLSDAVCLLDKHHQIEHCNLAMTKLFNTPENEMIGKKCWTIVHHTDVPFSHCPIVLMEKSLKRESHDVEVRGRWFQITVDPILDENRKLYKTVHMMRDITEQKSNQNLLIENQALLSESQRITRIGHYMLDISTGIWTSSETLNDIFGIDAAFSRNVESWLALIHPDDQTEMQHYFINHVVLNRNSFNKEYQILRPKDKVTRWVHGLGKLVFNSDGIPIHMFGTIQDITDRKIAENELTMERKRLAVTLRSIGDGVITTDTNGRVVFLNTIAEEMTGWTNAEAYGHMLSEVFYIVNEFTRKPCENPVEKVLKTGVVVELANHTMLIARDGREIILADSGSPIKDEKGDVFGVVLVFRDVTEKQKMLDTISRSQKLDSLGILAGGIAHDFNNLLGGIFGYIDLSLLDPSLNTTTHEHLDCAMRVLSRAKSLTQQLLTFAKGGSPVCKSGTLDKIVRDSTLFALSGSNVTCKFSADKDLKICEFDENQISQAINNIVLNAQQAMPMGGTIDVLVTNVHIKEKFHTILQAGDYVCITIQDYGVGIPTEIITKIFDPFFTTKQKGHGLGLATAYSILIKHEGCIDVTSESGKGSVFKLFIPASKNLSIHSEASNTLPVHGTGRILIMDDEPFIRETISAILQNLGYHVVCTKDGKDLLNQIHHDRIGKKSIDAIILDLTIPGGMGGKEVVKIIRQTDTTTPIIVASGYSEDPVMASPRDYGFTESIAKPFTIREISTVLKRVINSHT